MTAPQNILRRYNHHARHTAPRPSIVEKIDGAVAEGSLAVYGALSTAAEKTADFLKLRRSGIAHTAGSLALVGGFYMAAKGYGVVGPEGFNDAEVMAAGATLTGGFAAHASGAVMSQRTRADGPGLTLDYFGHGEPAPAAGFPEVAGTYLHEPTQELATVGVRA